jgi:RNA polymerase sigma factor (TIGR02999 family)
VDHQGTITRAVNMIASGTLPTDADPAVTRVYNELRALASQRLVQNPGAAIQPTDLVHDAFVKLFRTGQEPWESRAHFFGSAARAMQQIIIDLWRGWTLEVDEVAVDDIAVAPPVDPKALGEVVDQLDGLSPQIAEIVRLRVFAGLTVQQTADVLGLSERTVKRHFAFAKTWLYHQLEGMKPGAGAAKGTPPRA